MIYQYFNSKCSGCDRELGEDRPAISTPFDCPVCGRINFRWKAKWDYVFIWPVPLTKKFVQKGRIIRPEYLIDPSDEIYGRSAFGVVLSFGPGCIGKSDNKWHPTYGLKVGMHVVYDKFVPPRIIEQNSKGENELVVICGFRDVYGEVL